MSLVRKRSVTIRGHRTSFSLEDPFYAIITSIADDRKITLARLIAEIDEGRDRNSNLSSALRIYVLDWVMNGMKTAP
ncbi:ribbon-helix-helix domain-containing protein [Phyllobacterium sp. 22229]|uniref:Aryl-sulfate sulfotransferase n=1 Tax=Phyllobacterium myrsinacearum TaxID=28101 RepID=A0A2S9JXB4_9HYPH|nr:ribbon-helix-helix domain-containing protein [Phyllobacterium myrsinacearum]PRD57984.1 aryl-sulfate sulfotransferase [Phyllobacterium myrsinacearum]PWV96165.1 putative DNA-binding ribbon-helix-helix protein [Phyllobacterium myrsinacearum]RZS83447.1 putative DNA-binding ribbon-helix-helix protein [Phyllobacterium myrsinacearum]RZV09845.1 putative DNA-binding ribbon-helix-helix protein [Phyllobacterium myrsinacearum]